LWMFDSPSGVPRERGTRTTEGGTQ
jgi:hypothetical protein